jgi:NADPH:quinone reductase-like Zn-dependent oxidoreductase
VIDVVVGVQLIEADLDTRGEHVAIGWQVDLQSLSFGPGRPNATLGIMKAWQLEDTNGIDSYVVNDLPEPEPGRGQVRVKVRTSGLNHLDIWVSMGLPAPRHLPHTAGADAAGVVDAVGEGVAGHEVGDEVIIDPSLSCGKCAFCLNDDIVYCPDFAILGEHVPGTFTERVVVPAINVIPKPAAVDWDVAGSFGLAGVTAIRMLEKADLKRGETVLVVGVGGGVSASALSLAQAFGARVYVTSRSQEKIDWAVGEGAVGGFDSTSEFGKEMAALGGADLVIDNVGPATLKQSMRAAKAGGRIAICGGTSGAKFELNLPIIFFRQLELVGSSMGTHAQFARALNWIRLGKAKAPVAKVFPFAELPKALRFLESGDQVGNVVLTHD